MFRSPPITDFPITSVAQLSVLDPIARSEPDPRLHALRVQAPAFRDHAFKVWLLTRYADARAVLNDRTLKRFPGNAEEGSISRHVLRADTDPAIPIGERQPILLLDDPDHSRIRTPLARAFYARVARARALIDRVIAQTLDPLSASKRFDLVADVALPIPILTLAHIIGVPEAEFPQFRAWSEAVMLGLNPLRTPDETARMDRATSDVKAYFAAMLDDRRARPRDDLATDMVRAQADGTPVSDGEVVLNVLGLLVAGNLTTTDLLTSGVMLLLCNPEQLARLKADPSLVAQAVEEILRVECPVDSTARIVAEPREIAGCPMGKGASVMVSLRGANHDPSVFPDPDRFDIARRDAPHVAFGGGAHICIGAPLARMEAVAFFGAFFNRFPALRLAGEKLEYRSLPFFRGLERLIVET